ncbi:MAG: hypothetical protein RLO51_28250 [Thalassobaculum sp.]|uniref:hypothetical protein n=1 Tax=Thalassobaculum sp. TaxID=2022740 RepID=UPI0032EBACBD
MARPRLHLLSAPMAAAVAIALMPLGGGPLAQALCSAPVTPICATAVPATEPNGATDSEIARRRCVDDAETYREKLVEYRQCLEGALQETTAAVEAADRFIGCLRDGDAECRLQEAR